MTAAWKTVALRDVATLDSRRHDGSDKPFVGLEHIESGTGRLLRNVGQSEATSATFAFGPEHVLYGRLRPYLNKVHLPNFVGHCSTEIYPIRPHAELDRSYLFYWLTAPATVEAIMSTCTGARMPRANLKEVQSLRLPLPPLSEQHRIVAVLNDAFAGIGSAALSATEGLSYAERFAWGYLGDLFEEIGADWVREPIAKRVRFVDYRGKTPPKRETGIRLITAKNVKMGFVQRQPEEFIDSTAYPGWMTRGFPNKGDVLFTTEAPLGNVAQLDTDEPVVIGQRLITMQPEKEKLDPDFLKYMLLSRPLQSEVRAKATGATVLGIKASLLKQIEIRYPPSIVEQSRMVAKLDAVFAASQELVELYGRKLVVLAELKQSFLARAFSGELTREPIAA